MVVALKSEERDVAKTQDTFIMVFTLDGEILLDETEVRRYSPTRVPKCPPQSRLLGDGGYFNFCG